MTRIAAWVGLFCGAASLWILVAYVIPAVSWLATYSLTWQGNMGMVGR